MADDSPYGLGTDTPTFNKFYPIPVPYGNGIVPQFAVPDDPRCTRRRRHAQIVASIR